MAISRVKTWVSGEVLFASDLNSEFDNLLNNATSLVSPWTANMDAGGFRLITLGAGSVSSPTLQFSGDTNTGVYSPAADQVTLVAGGVQILQASGYTSAVNFLRAVSAQSGIAPSLGATGTDTDISLSLLTTGTGFVNVPTGYAISNRFYPGLGVGSANEGLTAITSGTLDLMAGGRRVLQASSYLNATNFLIVAPSQSGQPVTITAGGADTNISVQILGKGSGTLSVATAFTPASLGAGPSIGNTPAIHALYQENVVKGWINFKGTATASIYGSYNVTSLSRGGTGLYTITWARGFAATPYAVLGIASTNVAGTGANILSTLTTTPNTTTTTDIRTNDSADGAIDAPIVYVATLGAQ